VSLGAFHPDEAVELLRHVGGSARVDELSSGDLTVRASMDLSHRALRPATRQALRLLALLDAPHVAAWALAALLDITVGTAQAQLGALVDWPPRKTARPAPMPPKPQGDAQSRFRWSGWVFVGT
jgi:hypothetical protein